MTVRRRIAEVSLGPFVLVLWRKAQDQRTRPRPVVLSDDEVTPVTGPLPLMKP